MTMLPDASPAIQVPLDLQQHAHAFLVGLEGVGLSGAAVLLARRGLRVEGVDREPGIRCEALRAQGIPAAAEAEVASLPRGVDLVVRSAAVPLDHPLMQRAAADGMRIVTYAELLGALMQDREAICVAGSHGKTTTSSLLSWALVEAGVDPSFLVGGTVRGLETGARAGRGPHFIAESCEFDRSFHQHRPQVAIVTNVDLDHLDYYADLAEIHEAFRVFAARIPEGGTLVVGDAAAHIFRGHEEVSDTRIRARIQTYGPSPEADWRIVDIEDVAGASRTRFELVHEGRSVGRFEIPLLGLHNALNATAAIAASAAAGVSPEQVREPLASFRGVGRRLEQVADASGILILDDYGHHPVEIRAVVRGLRKSYPDRRLVLIFQPHQASRTRCLLAEFAAALAEADAVLLPPIYFARDSEQERRTVTSEDLARQVRAEGGAATTFPSLAALEEQTILLLRDGDLVVTMGAGNVDEVAHGLARRLS